MDIYKGLSSAETGGEDNPFIRTRVTPKGGSSAFGPVQITKGLLDDAIKRNLLSSESSKFVQDVMLPMQQKMLKYGAKDMVKGKEVYDYGKTGGFNVKVHGESYKKLADELINIKLKEAANKEGKTNIDDFLKRWRGKKPEKSYRKRFYKGYNKKTSHYKEE